MKTTRYDPSGSGYCQMDEDENGEYVKYEDLSSMVLELTKMTFGIEEEETKPDNKGTNMNGSNSR